jgi:primosomal protein N' (replication factor Y)
VALRDVAKVTGWGPAPELFDLAAWAAWRWAGRPASLLTAASPPGAVRNLPPSPSPLPSRDGEPSVDAVVADALGRRRGVLRLPPGADRYPLVRAAATAAGHALVLCPTIAQARRLAGRLGRDGHPVACVAHDRPGAAATGGWARAAAGATVVGARGGAWAPVRDIGRIVVLDEHDESYKAEQSPTWHARDVAIERAARAGVPCLLVSPCPTLEALAWGDLMVPSRATERRGWPTLEVVDRRLEDPVAAGLYSDRLVTMVRGGGRVLCVVNRRGRARLLACAACGELARCEVCAASVEQLERTTLRCRRCAAERPVVCLRCGASRLKNLRAGVARVREELEALAGEPVAEITAATATKDEPDGPETRIYAGTEAVLHQVPVADAVAFLDFDQELTAPRYRAAEQALALLARAARVVRGRAGGGRVLVQTRQPDHPVLAAARHADPARVTDVEAPLRRALRLPPAAAVALVSGPSAPSFIDALGTPPGVEVAAAAGGAWRLRADDRRTLCDALAAVSRPPGRLRIEVDPLRM